ncbi:pilus assembly protein [Serratia fonticola]|uniref:Pilus assembly protein n=1 Tax=Serratia fonticola TaxID=47917 RepID=A0ABY9PVU6_SERFO|nr:pilus assembly protein [Serratia fonticola]WMT16664.1 pilus assembly protein [Serratia fonticola]
MIKKLQSALVTSFWALSSFAYADGQLMVMPARSTVEGQQTRTVQVSNLGDKPLYLKVDLMRVENPGETPERKTAIGDISVPEMMANPAKLTLGPGQKRDINLVALKTPSRETLYRLYIVPVSSIKVVGNENKDKISAPLTFGVAYGVLVHHLPSSGVQTRAWTHQCTTKGLKLTSNGTVHSLFKQLQVTPAGSMSDEQKVFPGTPLVFPVKTLRGNVDGQPFDISCP